MRIYPLAQAGNPAATEFINLSGMEFNTIHANDFTFFEEVNAVIQEEPSSAFDPETLGLLRAIGIQKGKPFAPDERMKAILVDAVAVGNATARAITFATRDREAFFFPDRQWKTGFVGGSYEFMDNGARRLDARTLFHYYATGITPAMAAKMVGAGSQYAYAERDSEGRYLDGSKTYRVTLPPNVPVNNFWSFVVYDSQTRGLLQTDQRKPLDSDTWDLYNVREDFSLTRNLASERPEKLKELQALFMVEAEKYHVLPIDDRTVERVNPAIAGRPDLLGDRTSLTLYDGMNGMLENTFINVKNQSKTITAEIEIPAGAANGVILAQGGAFRRLVALCEGRPPGLHLQLPRPGAVHRFGGKRASRRICHGQTGLRLRRWRSRQGRHGNALCERHDGWRGSHRADAALDILGR
jgi:hypothetical protein